MLRITKGDIFMEDKMQCEKKEKSDAEIIKSILLDNDNDIAKRDRLYKLLYQVSEENEFNMDTDLIKECVDTINLIEGEKEQISAEKIAQVCRDIETQYKRHHRKQLMKTALRTATCILLVFLVTNVVAYAFGYNIIQIVSNWGDSSFNVFTGQKSDIEGNNITNRIIDTNINEAFIDIEPQPLLPAWLPEGYSFKYAERYDRKESINVLLYYEDTTINKVTIFDYTIYHENPGSNISYEKDERLVEIYKKDGKKYYILKNENQIQAIWNDSNVIYNIDGDISVDTMKKIINQMESDMNV